ncbi:hypothetical protein BDQ94DRAFT_145699 [Aspergillus welwitschiae]|uniref:Uncharacterized protein n=1 Tax=Aspergillus welwitschiae TaxID=1341132 RepID=A0A3F3PZI8_9EURO|nr:hypothetical protein BDQ94DRAFT_145699 [Aspergillus welwitschiae]RDH32245.1 hypothetical protein BDQ94DRAFT_145699 [Aspergillus welwitschiae]
MGEGADVMPTRLRVVFSRVVGWLAHQHRTVLINCVLKPLNVFFFSPQNTHPFPSSHHSIHEWKRRNVKNTKEEGREDTTMDLKKTVTDCLHSSPFPPSGLLKPVTGQVTQAVTNPSLDPFFGICMACHQNRILTSVRSKHRS